MQYVQKTIQSCHNPLNAFLKKGVGIRKKAANLLRDALAPATKRKIIKSKKSKLGRYRAFLLRQENVRIYFRGEALQERPDTLSEDLQ